MTRLGSSGNKGNKSSAKYGAGVQGWRVGWELGILRPLCYERTKQRLMSLLFISELCLLKM